MNIQNINQGVKDLAGLMPIFRNRVIQSMVDLGLTVGEVFIPKWLCTEQKEQAATCKKEKYCCNIVTGYTKTHTTHASCGTRWINVKSGPCIFGYAG